jgi:hypothetical protein
MLSLYADNAHYVVKEGKIIPVSVRRPRVLLRTTVLIHHPRILLWLFEMNDDFKIFYICPPVTRHPLQKAS